jgi:hypothetical protein
VPRGAAAGPLFQTRGQRGKNRNGALETRSVFRIVRELGQKVGLHVWCTSLRHTSITQAAELGQRTGLGLDKIGAHSRHRYPHAQSASLHRDVVALCGRARPAADADDPGGSRR